MPANICKARRSIRPRCGASTPGTTGRSPDLGIGAGVRYVGESYGDAGNTFVIPSYTLFDAAMSYDLRLYAARSEGLEGCRSTRPIWPTILCVSPA